MDGQKVRLRDYRGKIVVLNFWATWCGPCRDEMPMIGDAERAWKRKGVVFIEVSLDEKGTRGNIPGFMQRVHSDLPVWVGASPDDLQKLKLGDGVPDTAFVDEHGVIVSRVLGEIRRSELEERLTWLTGGRSGPRPEAVVNHMPPH
jgi:thiol-disulfide isomerase/thioredoxin